MTRGDLEPARGNVHVCKLVRALTNIQIRTVTAERHECSKCICTTNALQLYFVKLASPEVSKAAVREVVRECEECQSIDPAPVSWKAGRLGVYVWEERGKLRWRRDGERPKVL